MHDTVQVAVTIIMNHLCLHACAQFVPPGRGREEKMSRDETTRRIQYKKGMAAASRTAHLARRQFEPDIMHEGHGTSDGVMVNNGALIHEHEVVEEVERLGRGLQEGDYNSHLQMMSHRTQPLDDLEQRRRVLHW
jgi:hypothetical protein